MIHESHLIHSSFTLTKKDFFIEDQESRRNKITISRFTKKKKTKTPIQASLKK